MASNGELGLMLMAMNEELRDSVQSDVEGLNGLLDQVAAIDPHLAAALGQQVFRVCDGIASHFPGAFDATPARGMRLDEVGTEWS